MPKIPTEVPSKTFVTQRSEIVTALSILKFCKICGCKDEKCVSAERRKFYIMFSVDYSKCCVLFMWLMSTC